MPERDADLLEYEDIIKEEINVKAVRFGTKESRFVDVSLKLNLNIAGPKYGKRAGAIQTALRALSPEEAGSIAQQGNCSLVMESGQKITVSAEDLLIEKRAKPGYACASGYQMTVALNTRLTKQLEQEGWYGKWCGRCKITGNGWSFLWTNGSG